MTWHRKSLSAPSFGLRGVVGVLEDLFWLVNDWNIWMIFPNIGKEQKSHLTFIFFRGVGIPPTPTSVDVVYIGGFRM